MSSPWSPPEPEAIPLPSPERESTFMCAAIREFAFPVLRGHPPEVQGAALAELVATWLAGFAPVMREDIYGLFDKAVHDLVGPCEREMFGDAGHPGASA